MQRATTTLKQLIASERFIMMPAAYHPMGGRQIAAAGFKAVYCGGFVTGGSRAVTEPLLTMDEQVRVAGEIASAVGIPLMADGGAGFGEPLHTMRSVREFIRAGVAGIHIEDQLYPKRAHYHKYVAHAVPAKDFIDKIKYACRARDEVDKDFVVVARTDTCRFEGLDVAVDRINAAADVGADMGLLFPRNDQEMADAPRRCRIPLVYVQSRGNRDGRPLKTIAQMTDMGYRVCLDAITPILIDYHFNKLALAELAATGTYTGMTEEECRTARQEIENLIGLEDFYRIEEETVEETQWGKR